MDTFLENNFNLFEKILLHMKNINYTIYAYYTIYSDHDIFGDDCRITIRIIVYESDNLLFDLYMLLAEQNILKCRIINDVNKHISEEYINNIIKSNPNYNYVLDRDLNVKDNLYRNLYFMLTIFEYSIPDDSKYQECIEIIDTYSDEHYENKEKSYSIFNPNYVFDDELLHIFIF